MSIKQYLKEKEQAAVLRVSTRTLRDWRQRKIVPFFKIGRVIFFDPERVQQALAKFEKERSCILKAEILDTLERCHVTFRLYGSSTGQATGGFYEICTSKSHLWRLFKVVQSDLLRLPAYSA
jgi:hypothetical protein